MVVNKVNNIETEFRFFKMEILAKESEDFDDMVIETKENGCGFKLDFATVYWNPRLSTEHLRIVEKLRKKTDVVYDVFAGVGPFAVPAAKKGCQVMANDLNPESFKWLEINAKKNKVGEHLKAYQLDGRVFIRDIVGKHLLEEWLKYERMELTLIKKYHIVMNLPALAMEFLDAFRGWMDSEQEAVEGLKDWILPQIHCYCFLKGEFEDPKKAVQDRVESVLKSPVSQIEEIVNVRNVAPNKEMYRISFTLPRNVILSNSGNKKLKTE
jgi:tRNA (guanine37-N1)-methyltransferase